MVDKTKKDKNDNSVSPTQNQMDEWVKQELAEADDDGMLSTDGGSTSIFEDEPTE